MNGDVPRRLVHAAAEWRVINCIEFACRRRLRRRLPRSLLLPGEEGEGDSEKPATDEENSAMREKMIFGRKKARKSFRVSPTQCCQMAKFDPFKHEAVWELIYESTINLYLWRTLQNTYMYYIYILHCHSTFLTHDFFCWHLEWSINNLR